MSLKFFTHPAILKQIGHPRLTRFFRDFTDELQAANISLPGHALMMALKTPNVLIRVDGLPGGNQLVLPKAVQRNPIRGIIEHVDLIMVRRGEKVTVDVPVQVTGEVFPGGLLDQQLVQVAVEAEATNIPSAFEVDVEGMEIGAAVHAGELMYGGWVFTAGYFVAAAGEVQGLRAAPKIAHGG